MTLNELLAHCGVDDMKPGASQFPVDRIKNALSLLYRFGQFDGAHHKAWVIDQVARYLAGDHYDEFVRQAKDGEDGPDTYEWDPGIPP